MKSWQIYVRPWENKNREKSHGADCLECGIFISEGCLAQVKQIFHQERCGCI